MAYIIAIDPGKNTGVAKLYNGKFNSNIMDTYRIYNELAGLLEERYPRPNVIYSTKPDVVVCEDYIVTQQTIQKSRQNYSLELIGAFRFVCDLIDVPFVLQTPAQAKSFATDDKLKKLGWYRPGTGHDNDAARHLMVYALNHGLLDVRELI